MNDTLILSRHLNILGCLAILVAILFFVVFFNNEEIHNNAVYFIGSAFAFLNISVLSFGFSKTFELLDKISK